MTTSEESIKKSLKSYLIVGLILFIFTAVTVAVATVPALDVGKRGLDKADIILGLTIATFKVSCVGLIFMHLNHEKKLIYLLFFGAMVFAIFLFVLTGVAFWDPIEFKGFYKP